MKKMLLLTIALLALGVSIASAQGTLSLAYDVCRVAATTSNDFVWPNSTPDACTDPANSGLNATMCAAFKNTSTIPGFSLATSTIDILVGNGTSLSDFWSFGTGACHANGMVAASQIQGTGGIALPANCQNPYGTGAQNTSFGSVDSPASGRIHWSSDHQRSAVTNLLAPTSTGGYVASVIFLTWDDAAGDPAFTCAGCSDPACIVLNQVDFFNGSGAAVGHIDTPASGIRQYVTFYGGAASCPGAVPTRNTTWGAVKALYR